MVLNTSVWSVSASGMTKLNQLRTLKPALYLENLCNANYFSLPDCEARPDTDVTKTLMFAVKIVTAGR